MGIGVKVIPDLIVGVSKLHGKGVFAGRHFNSGDQILEFKGILYEFDSTMTDIPDDFAYLQVGKNLFLGPDGSPWGAPDDLVNHSCDPNSAVIIKDGKVTLRAICPIKPMMEILYDYALTMSNDPWTMSCRCGHEKCRKTVGEYKTLPSDVKRRYEYMKIVPEYVILSNGHGG